jgi:hypothetical protein
VSLAGHCSGLYQTIRDENVDMQGRGALNFLGGLVALVDDAANDETEVHIGKQPDLTDLFLTANAAPHLTIGLAGKTTRVRDDLRVDGKLNVGSNASPASTVRAQILTWPQLGALNATLLQQNLTGVQTANSTIRRGFGFLGTYDLAGFNLNEFSGVASVPIVDDVSGASVLLTYAAYRGGIDDRALLNTPDASVYDAIEPNISTIATRGHGYRARNQGLGAVLTAFGFRAEEMSGSPANRPYQDEGAPVGDPHGNRHRANTQFGSLVGAFGGGDGVVGLADATTGPTGAIAGGGVFSSEAGYLRWQDSNGSKQRIAAQEVGLTAVNGNNNNFAIGDATYARITGPTAAFTITGIAGGYAGRMIVLHNATNQNMTLSFNDANSNAANRLFMFDGLNRVTVGNGGAILVYDATAAFWIVYAFEA